MQTELSGPQHQFQALCVALHKAHVSSFVHEKGSPEWWAWHGWRKKNGLPVGFMESRPKWSVPSDMPPDGSLSTALDEATAGTAGRRRVA